MIAGASVVGTNFMYGVYDDLNGDPNLVEMKVLPSPDYVSVVGFESIDGGMENATIYKVDATHLIVSAKHIFYIEFDPGYNIIDDMGFPSNEQVAITANAQSTIHRVSPNGRITVYSDIVTETESIHWSCLEGGTTETTCTSCRAWQELISGVCEPRCDPACFGCSGAQPNNCSTCRDGYFE
jgi:hypothetical protein